MTVEETLKSCIYNYHSIFPNKWAVYHHWFAVNGNGYEWVKGCLVEKYSQAQPVPEGFILTEQQKSFDRPPFTALYPLCQYAKIITTPEDITEEWGLAATEFYEYLLRIYDNTTIENQNWIDKIDI